MTHGDRPTWREVRSRQYLFSTATKERAADGWQFPARNLAWRNAFRGATDASSPSYFDFEVPVAATVNVQIRMKQNVRILPTVDIGNEDPRGPLRKEGFYDRLAAGNGLFVTPEMVAAIRPVKASDALASIPNVVVHRRGNRTRITSSGTCTASAARGGQGSGGHGGVACENNVARTWYRGRTCTRSRYIRGTADSGAISGGDSGRRVWNDRDLDSSCSTLTVPVEKTLLD